MSNIIKNTAVVLVIFCVSSTAYAANLGHYSPDSNGVIDYVMPSDKGLSLLVYNKYYSSNNFRGPGGSKFDLVSASDSKTKYINIWHKSIPVTVTGSAATEFDFDLDNFSQSLDLTWVPGVKLLGADYALRISPSWGYARTQVKAKASASCTLSVGDISRALSAGVTEDIAEKNTGFGDLYLQPLWLAWRGEHYDMGLSYGFYAPTGYYEKNGIANIGLGFWTQQLQMDACYYPFADHATAIVIRPTYEWNSRKIHEDVTPGQTMTFEYGLSQQLHPRAGISVLGYNQLQLTGERGSAATDKKALSYTAGIGALINYWVIKDKCSLVAKFNKEYGTRYNFQGDSWSLNLEWIF